MKLKKSNFELNNILNFFSYIIRLSSSNLTDETNPVFVEVEKVIKHPLYVKDEAYFDAGIAFARTPFHYTSTLRPICLPVFEVDSDDYLPGHLVTLAGWGKYFISAKRLALSTQLKFINLKVLFICKLFN